MKEWALYSGLATLAWGLWAFLPKFAVNSMDPKSALIYEVMGGVATWVLGFGVMGGGGGGREQDAQGDKDQRDKGAFHFLFPPYSCVG